MHDLPTVTVCWELLDGNIQINRAAYSKDFIVDVKTAQNGKTKTISLVKDRFVNTLFGLQFQISEFFTSNLKAKQCHKISAKWNQHEIINMSEFEVKIFFNFSIDASNVHTVADIVITSEESSYGLAGQRWYDGKVQEDQRMQLGPLLVFSGDFMNIVVNEYKNTRGHGKLRLSR